MEGPDRAVSSLRGPSRDNTADMDFQRLYTYLLFNLHSRHGNVLTYFLPVETECIYYRIAL